MFQSDGNKDVVNIILLAIKVLEVTKKKITKIKRKLNDERLIKTFKLFFWFCH